MEDLFAFAVVVEQRSLNKASVVLNLSQPALSRKIKHLEDSLGVALFERKGKRLELTRAGQVCYEFAVDMRKLHRDMTLAINQFKNGENTVSMTIGASLTTLQSTLPDLIAHYTREFPHTDIHALTGKTHEVVTFVKEGKVDVGLVASLIQTPGLQCVPLFDDHLCLVLSAEHPYAELKSLQMKDLHDLPMILFSKGTWYRVMMDDLFQNHAVFPNVKMEIDSFEAIIRLVSSGNMAATLLPKSYLRSPLLEHNELCVRMLPELTAAKRTTSLIYTERAAADPAVRAFLDKGREYFSGERVRPKLVP
ncbi:LysR family transcriptional regulator [Paenibacillus sp. J31TS4]|uniref:LysR family transcriptional regulator n=1 Tax=Paenibacillus sp. J31TS4 TaxID=2807195 RepID=UPI001BCD6472|nr:LysR family transcriptional regulator [Paenibacillus sp. J31TS4]